MTLDKKALLAAAVLAATLVPGCRSVSSNEATGAGIGALVGGGAGYALGHNRGNEGNGALLGAAVGGLVGFLVGDAVDERQAEHAYGGRPIDRVSAPWGSSPTTHPCPGCDDPPPPPYR